MKKMLILYRMQLLFQIIIQLHIRTHLKVQVLLTVFISVLLKMKILIVLWRGLIFIISHSLVHSSQKSDPLDKKSLICGYCKKKGHIISDCFRLQRRNDREPKPLSSGSCGFTAPLYASKVKSPVVQACKSSFCD